MSDTRVNRGITMLAMGTAVSPSIVPPRALFGSAASALTIGTVGVHRDVTDTPRKNTGPHGSDEVHAKAEIRLEQAKEAAVNLWATAADKLDTAGKSWQRDKTSDVRVIEGPSSSGVVGSAGGGEKRPPVVSTGLAAPTDLEEFDIDFTTSGRGGPSRESRGIQDEHTPTSKQLKLVNASEVGDDTLGQSALAIVSDQEENNTRHIVSGEDGVDATPLMPSNNQDDRKKKRRKQLRSSALDTLDEGLDEDGVDASQREIEEIFKAGACRYVAELEKEAAAIRNGTHPDMVRAAEKARKDEARRNEAINTFYDRGVALATQLHETQVKAICDEHDIDSKQDEQGKRERAKQRRQDSRFGGWIGTWATPDPTLMNTRQTRASGEKPMFTMYALDTALAKSRSTIMAGKKDRSSYSSEVHKHHAQTVDEHELLADLEKLRRRDSASESFHCSKETRDGTIINSGDTSGGRANHGGGFSGSSSRGDSGGGSDQSSASNCTAAVDARSASLTVVSNCAVARTVRRRGGAGRAGRTASNANPARGNGGAGGRSGGGSTPVRRGGTHLSRDAALHHEGNRDNDTLGDRGDRVGGEDEGGGASVGGKSRGARGPGKKARKGKGSSKRG